MWDFSFFVGFCQVLGLGFRVRVLGVAFELNVGVSFVGLQISEGRYSVTHRLLSSSFLWFIFRIL